MYYSLRPIGSNIWFSGDISIVGLRFSYTTATRIYGLNVDTRFPLPLDWRVSP